MTVVSFSPLAARLAAAADEIRPVDGARDDWAKFVALVWCVILQMLIILCEALDARAASVVREREADNVATVCSGRVATRVAGRSPRLTLVAEVQAISPRMSATLSGMAGILPVTSRLGRSWTLQMRSRRKTRTFSPGSSTLYSLRYRNLIAQSANTVIAMWRPFE